ncbi:MAG: hypothetical protein OXN83_04425, partial [Oligoflexia bacterium]|nr:hypothetical protein [Oligoflexia bacterium]
MRHLFFFFRLNPLLVWALFQISVFPASFLWAGELGQCQNIFSNLSLDIRQPKELDRGSGRLRRWFGGFFAIPHNSLSDLAEDIYSNKEEYDLVFRGDKGLFTDLGLFDLLEKSPAVTTIKANSTKSFHIARLPLGAFAIYLRNNSSYGEELGFVASQVVTGTLINWFQTKSPTRLIFTATPPPITPLRLSLELDDLERYTNPGVLPALKRLSKMYELMGNKNLSLAVELASYQNQLQYMNQPKNYSESQILETYKEAKKLFGFWGEEKVISSFVFSSLLSEIDIKVAYHIFEKSGVFFSETSDQLALFMGLSYELKMKKTKGDMPYEESYETLSVWLEEHKRIYKKASDPYIYLASVMSGRKNKADIKDLKADLEYIEEHAKADHEGPLLVLASTSKNS